MQIIPTVALFVMLAVQAVRADDKVSVPDFNHYPQTVSFKKFVAEQTDSKWHLERGHFLAITFFPHGDYFARREFITEDGLDLWAGITGDGSASGSSSILSKIDLRNIRAAVEQIPNTNSLPPIERLVFVSFKDGTNWITHACDKSNLPPAVKTIVEITKFQLK
jgi:hypothetical protein